MQISFDLLPIDLATLSEVEQEIVDHINLSMVPLWEEKSEDLLCIYDTLTDIRGIPILLLAVEIPRSITARALALADDSLLSGIAVAILVFLALTLMLQKIVVGPLRRLTNHAIEIAPLP